MKKLQCSVCDYITNKKYNLNRHIQGIHKNTNIEQKNTNIEEKNTNIEQKIKNLFYKS